MRPENRADLRNQQMRGTVCAFELVRGTGDAEVARLAELQHGHVHLQQLRAASIGRNALSHRLRIGRLHATLPGVYLVGRPQRDVFGRMMAAALYFKGDGLVSRRAAAQAWGLLDVTQVLTKHDEVDVLLPVRSGGSPAGIRVHRTRSFGRSDIRWCNNIPVTSPARTLLDLAAVLDELELEAALLTALGRNLVRPTQLRDVIARNQRAKGVAVLRELVERPESLNDTRSRYERKLLRLLQQAELPPPVTNMRIAGRIVDAYWPAFGLVLQLEGWRYHRGRRRFESDSVRDQQVTAAGRRLMRVTARQIDQMPYALVARIATTIANLRLEPDPDLPF